MSTVVCFGEIMMRLAPELWYRFTQAKNFGVTFGGSEANTAVSLANFGIDAAFVSKLPDNDLGQAAINSLRQFGVDTSFIVRGGRRIGIYFLEKGASQRPSKVIYDRDHSAAAEAVPGDFDWKRIFDGARWFHWTGITAALSGNAAAICAEACKAAKDLGLTVSCDLNYRKNLWSREKAGAVMGPLMDYVDLLFANEEDAADVFGVSAAGADISGGKLGAEAYTAVAGTLAERFGIKKIAVTLRESISASDNNWGAMFYDNGQAFFSRKYPVHIVDRVGGGDSYSAGLIYALLASMEGPAAVEFAAAASCLKHTVEGDFNMVSLGEVQKLAAGDASGRVQR